MNKDDIIIWYRFYLWDGESIDKKFEPLTYSSHSNFVDAFTEAWTEYSNQDQDYDIVDWDYIDESGAWGMLDKRDVWDAYNNLFDLSKEYGIKPETLFSLVDYGWGIEQLEDVMENAYEGEHDYPSLRNFAYYLVDEELLNEDYYASLFDYEGFGYALKMDFDLEMLVEEYGYDISEAEDLLDGRDEDFAEWYIEMIGDVTDLGKDTLRSYVDFQRLERELEYEGYYVIDGHVFRPY
tara:strand:- start:89 stop:799 length:711 start_codon:yes stop_codon:yes gene_type:complete